MLSKSQKYDAIIIGQGLAGSLLAWELIQHGQSVLVIDNSLSQSSSMVAAGIINPITGHRLNLTENFAQYMQSAKPLYESLKTKIGKQFLFEIKQQRIIKNQGQATYLAARLNQDEYSNYISKSKHGSLLFKEVEHGIVNIHNSYRVDVKTLLEGVACFLKSIECLIHQKVDYSDIKTTDNGISIGNFHAKKLFFCEGFQAIHNPWLKELPFKLAKGEILKIETSRPPSNQPDESMLNWGNWLLPVGSQKAYLGASYAWNKISTSISKDIAQTLITSLHSHTNLHGSVIEHNAGIRPTTQNRQFFIGKIKALSHAYCFNGFGSKGCLTIPYFAQIIRIHLTKDIPLSSLCGQLSQLPEQLTAK